MNDSLGVKLGRQCKIDETIFRWVVKDVGGQG